MFSVYFHTDENKNIYLSIYSGVLCGCWKFGRLDSRTAVWRIEQSSIKSKEEKTVAQLWGIGQTAVVKALRAGRQLSTSL